MVALFENKLLHSGGTSKAADPAAARRLDLEFLSEFHIVSQLRLILGIIFSHFYWSCSLFSSSVSPLGVPFALIVGDGSRARFVQLFLTAPITPVLQ